MKAIALLGIAVIMITCCQSTNAQLLTATPVIKGATVAGWGINDKHDGTYQFWCSIYPTSTASTLVTSWDLKWRTGVASYQDQIGVEIDLDNHGDQLGETFFWLTFTPTPPPGGIHKTLVPDACTMTSPQ